MEKPTVFNLIWLFFSLESLDTGCVPVTTSRGSFARLLIADHLGAEDRELELT